MAANTSVADLIIQRDNLMTALTDISSGAISSYTIGDRTFTYETRAELLRDIRAITTEILARTPGNSANARGRNRMDFSSWE